METSLNYHQKNLILYSVFNFFVIIKGKKWFAEKRKYKLTTLKNGWISRHIGPVSEPESNVFWYCANGTRKNPITRVSLFDTISQTVNLSTTSKRSFDRIVKVNSWSNSGFGASSGFDVTSVFGLFSITMLTAGNRML